MSYRFFYLYLAGGTVALLLLIYQLISQYPQLSDIGISLNAIPVVLLYYMAFKVYREKEDKEMM